MGIGIFFIIGIIIILILLSAFFSGSETALTAASQERLHAQEKDGDKRAGLVNKIREKKDRMIGALLLGNNLVNILASALATSLLISVFGDAGVVYATIVMTMVVLIFAEVLPKTYALHHADRMAMRIAPIMRVVIFIFAPITEMVTWIVRLCLRIVGVDISKVTAGSHLALLKGAIELHHGPEDEVQQQRAMLRSILDLVDVDVEEIMVHRQNVKMIDADETVENIVRSVLDSPYTRLPLWRGEQDNIVGVLHAKLLLKEMSLCHGDVSKIRIERAVMDPWFIPETSNLYEQLQAFRERKEHFAVVVDEYGALMGIVTLEDILEEIVGEIDDEHDVRVSGVKRSVGNSYLIDGSVTIRDLKREFEWDLPDEHYSTLAGLVLHESQMLPEAGQSFIFHDFQFDVVRRVRNQLTLIRVTPPLPIQESA